jgi:hypothetical protein
LIFNLLAIFPSNWNGLDPSRPRHKGESSPPQRGEYC